MMFINFDWDELVLLLHVHVVGGDAQIRDKARSSPAVGLLRALRTHFASAPFPAPVADFRGGGSHAAHYQAVTAAQSQGPGGVGSVGYVEVAGHELLFDLWGCRDSFCRGALFGNLHHVEVHQSGVLVLVLLRQLQESILFVEGNGREVGIDGNEAEGQGIALALQFLDEFVHHVAPNILASKIQGYGKTPYLHARITAELLAFGKTGTNFLPAAANHFILAYLVTEQTEISSNTSIVCFKDERIGNAKFLRRLCIVKQELIKVFVAAVKAGQRIIWSKGNESHTITSTILFCS